MQPEHQRHLLVSAPFLQVIAKGDAMSQIDIKKITSGEYDGKTVFICDYRQPDLSKKPARNVAPIEVVVCSNDTLPKNKTVYCSHSHFRPKKKDGTPGSKIIAPFDNTGYRSRTGVALIVFDNMQECKDQYECDVRSVMDQWKERRKTAVESIDNEIKHLSGLLG